METANEVKTIMAEDVEIVGSIKCTDSIEIKGKLDGDLTCGGKAVIGESAVIKGSLSVDSISIVGQVDGNITAKDRIEMKSSARVNGDIKSKRLTVEDGVSFVGKSEVNPSEMQSSRQAAAEKTPDAGASSPAGGADKNREPDEKVRSSGILGRK